MRFWFTAVLLLAVGFSQSACFDRFSAEWHEKITLHLEIDGKHETFSSVRRVRWTEPSSFNASGHWQTRMEGEAVVADLGNRGVLFALLGSKELFELTAKANTVTGEQKRLARDRKELLSRVSEFTGQVMDVPERLYPMLVKFAYIDDPASIRKVDPADLEKSFGGDVRLRRVTLEITDEPVIKGRVEQVLEWWENPPVPIGGGSLRRYGDDFYGVGKGSFVTWD